MVAVPSPPEHAELSSSHGFGDLGQRYEVRCLDERNQPMVVGWTSMADGGALARMVKLHPEWHTLTIIDRQSSPVIS